MEILIHYDEITLKGKNFKSFENRLMNNVVRNLERNNVEIKEKEDDSKRLYIQAEGSEEDATRALKKVFGVHDFSFIETCGTKKEDIRKTAKKLLEGKQGSFASRATRADKTLSYDSMDLNEAIGDEAVDMGFEINLDEPDLTMYSEVTRKRAYVYTEKIAGPKGIPVGTNQRVLCLLSGGIDSPVAAYLAMKRGCPVDFLHFHTKDSAEEVMESKISDMVEILKDYQKSSRIHLVPYGIYRISSDAPRGYDLVVFKNFMLRTAQEILEKENYGAIVTGDSLSQVASQTLANLEATREKVDCVVLNPLITCDKKEIVSLARKIGTFEVSTEEYSDCCSIVSKNPKTEVGSEDMQKVLEEMDVQNIIEETLEESVILNV